MKRIGIFTIGAVALLISGCDWIGIRGNGHVVADQRPVTEFAEIDASGGLRIEWQSGPPALSITTDENLVQHIDTHVSGKTLRLRTHDRLRPTRGIKISVSSAKLDGADLSGAVDLVAKGVGGPRFYVQTSGASDVTVDGNVEQLLADMTGASDLHAKGLQTKTVEISTTGAASAYVSATETLKVAITGAGDVTYSGNPKTVEKHVTGAGSIRHKE
jgi:hypothetical protein